MSTSDEEATSLFCRADKSRLASGRQGGGSALRSPSKRLLPPPPDDSSSDIEFVGTSSAIKRRARQDGKGKGKATPDQAPSRRLATTSKGLSTRKTGRPSRRLASASSLDSSSEDDNDDDPRMPTSGQILPSATQIADSGATLRALAREKGWQGQSPPPRSRSRTEPNKPAAKKRRQKRASDDSEDMSDFGQRGGRNVSASTEQTTISDQSSSSHTKQRKSVAATAPPAGAKRASKNAAASTADTTARAKPRQKRASKTAAASSSPSPELELDLDNLPPPPESFWGVDTSLAKASAATKKHKHGEATKRLQTLSEQRAMLVLPDDDEDEIAIADSGSSSAGENERFELTAVKSKREKEDALARLRAKRGKQSVEPVARNSPPRADSRDPPRQGNGKGKQKAVEPATAACPLCAIEFAVDELEAHTNGCLDCFGMDEDFEPTAAPAPVAGPSKSAFRPAGAAAAAAPPRPPPAAIARSGAGARTDNLAAALFPSSPAQNRATGAATSKKRYSPADDDADDEVFAISPVRKGKGKRPAQRPDGYLTSDGYDELPALDASLNGTIIDLCADEDDEMTHSRPGRGGAIFAAGTHRRGDGRDGAINSRFAPGPPANGSSPPRGSLYISTMSAAYIDGYARLYAKPVPKGKKARTSTSGANFDPDADDSEAREFDALAPPAPKRASGFGRGGGRGGKRGGNRRGSWSWRARARGRGGGKRT